MAPPRNAGRRFARLALAAALLGAAAAAQAEPFRFVALPDTQVYAENRFPGEMREPVVTEPRGTGAIFYDQTEWVRDNAEALGIRYVGHLGDIVQDGNDLTEWALARDAMDVLIDESFPLGTVMGNHDDNHVGFYARNYLDHFGPQVFQGEPWFMGSSPSGGANWQLLEHGYYKIGFLNFSIDHPQEEIDWATQVVMDHPDTIFIVGTHRYLFDFKLAGGRYGEDLVTPLGGLNISDDFVDGVPEPNDAEEFFTEFVSQHPNILMIHAGHFHAEWLRLDGLNPQAQTIIQILTDYQSTRNGGDGYLRIYDLDFENATFSFDTYSPTLDRQRTTIDHFVETIYLGYGQRDNVMDVLGVNEEVYLGLIQLAFGNRPDTPDGFLHGHPDFDSEQERAYYQTYLEELLSIEGPKCVAEGEPEGCVPAFFFDIDFWEGLWLLAFSRGGLDDKLDFGDWVRSPRQTLEVDFSRYFTPNPEQALAMAFESLRAALADLAPDDFLASWASRWLLRRVESAERLVDRGRLQVARWLLRLTVLARVDGCARDGEPDAFWLWRDLVVDCDAQEPVHDAVSEVLERIGDLL
jgi:hypothetical protein